MKITKEKENPGVTSGRSHVHTRFMFARDAWLLVMLCHIVIAHVTKVPSHDALLSAMLSEMKKLSESNAAFKVSSNLLQIICLKSVSKAFSCSISLKSEDRPW